MGRHSDGVQLEMGRPTPDSQTPWSLPDVVLMTTNRPDVLEPALASRPCRISQAIEVPLPDADCRLRIFRLFTANLDVSSVDLDSWVSRTDGASPAFLEELFRRAILFAVQRPRISASGSPIPAADRFEPTEITEQDLSVAMTEILTSGGRLTQRLLGYRTEESV